MDDNKTLSPHESLELNNLLSSTYVIAKKLQGNMPMVEDVDLNSYMELCLRSKKKCIKAIQAFSGGSKSFQNL